MNDKSDQSFVLPDAERRALLRQMGSADALTALAPGLWLASGGNPAAAGVRDPVAVGYGLKSGPFDVDLQLRAQLDTAKILPGTLSDVWRYTAELIKGPANTLAALDESYPGPVIRLRRGQRFRARLENRLPEDTTVHWHGLHVPPDVDGQPRLPIKPGETMTVAFDVVARAGLYWYHF